MKQRIENIRRSFSEEIKNVKNGQQLEGLRIKYLGRKGLIAQVLSEIPNLPVAQRATIGRLANQLKDEISHGFNERLRLIKQKGEEKTLSILREEFDFTLPGIKPRIGHKHPLHAVIEEICNIFISLGFQVVEGPEIETEYNNFEALNIPLEHPSRDAFDTFYLSSKGNKDERLLLRSHTSPVQIRVMKKERPPIQIIVPGRVYRPDAVDASHSFMFHQIEGLLVDKEVTFSHLKGVLQIFVQRFFGSETRMRFRPHFFPFTEPSAEVDISCIICSGKRYVSEGKPCRVCGGKGWLEILGSGMVHPKVFRNVGIDPKRYTGFAFGMGIERITMLKYGIDDIRLFFENDLRFLEQFR